MHKVQGLVAVIILSLYFVKFANGSRCYQCRSRGIAGSCKDPLIFNADEESEPGITAIPCASGWCGKVIEGAGAYAVDDYDQATQRMCLQRGPDDNEERCANTVYNYKKVYMCFCHGDLCNSAESLRSFGLTSLCSFGAVVAIFRVLNFL